MNSLFFQTFHGPWIFWKMTANRFLLIVLALICLEFSSQAKMIPRRSKHESHEIQDEVDPRPPVFVRKHQGLLIRRSAGTFFNFKCKARGNPKPKVDWYKNGMPLDSIKRRFEPYDFRRWELYVNNLTPNDTANYTCVVSNNHGSVSRTFDARVLIRTQAVKPSVREGFPGNHTVLYGSNLELRCDLEQVDSFSPPMIEWFHLYEVNGSLRDINGSLYRRPLQKCSYNSRCFWDDPTVFFSVPDPTVSYSNIVLHKKSVFLSG